MLRDPARGGEGPLRRDGALPVQNPQFPIQGVPFFTNEVYKQASHTLPHHIPMLVVAQGHHMIFPSMQGND
ncbi:hypothetical protein F3Y22_tig00111877pilonHSYRG00367 [Hibiscus syriacus]|uniref:Uncharacterized protein n=1 Tax=Hibiscus syriacus TaxID=106335 RepID=A0A6A2X9Q7_HIBSY|nr:hypothetical protein F3Y22_tig00111877pilonHSYRG00367 [Hibiscus syriacus]